MLTKIAPTNKTYGIDAARYQTLIDWKEVKSAGKKFAILKATDGHHTVDPLFNTHFAQAKAAGVLTGAYHFIDFAADESQAHNLINTVPSLKGCLPPMLDLERSFASTVPMSRTEAALALAILFQFKTHYGNAMVYGGPYFLSICSMFPGFAEYLLFIAHYGTLVPLIPAPWKGFAFHQYTGTGKFNLPNMPEAFDFDYFNGTEQELNALVLT